MINLNYLYFSFLYSFSVVSFYSYIISYFKSILLNKILAVIGIIFDLNILIIFLILVFKIAFSRSQILFDLLIIVTFGVSILFQIINKLRLYKHLSNVLYLKKSYLINLGIMIGFQLIILISYFLKFNIFALLSVLFSVLIFGAIFKNYRKLYRRKFNLNKFVDDNSLPSISVAIPTRNETTDLINILKTVIDCDYPKLEILVLDDCSSSPKTAQIIRQFSHDGVIFVQGNTPPKDFLAKNYAYQQLYDASNGEYIIFMGVDCRVDRYFLRRIIEFMLTKNKKMVSVLPINEIARKRDFYKVIPQTLRYSWELAFFRRFVNRPPVLSSCWATSRDLLLKFGGFEGLKKDIIPERTIANQALSLGDFYSFLIANEQLKISSVKQYNEQLNTAIRVKYPTLKRNLGYILIIITIQFTVFFLPILEIINGFMNGNNLISYTFIVVLLINWVSYFFILKITTRKNLYFHSISYLWAFGLDIYLWVLSSLKYEFGKVVWKDRNICIPVRKF
ncbi:MAG: glycosyltransferase [Patescibacteria group bacterium]|nr:glycosyltransferase [Patescibacteria group bacterium]